MTFEEWIEAEKFELDVFERESLRLGWKAGRASMKAEALRQLDETMSDGDYFPWRFTLEHIEP